MKKRVPTIFISITFDIFGFLTPKTIDLLQKMQRVIHNNVVSPKT